MEEKKKALILTIGNTIEPPIKVINQVKPDKVYFIHTENSIIRVNEILKKVEYKDFEKECCHLFDHENINEVFNLATNIIKKIKSDKENYEIIADYTVGTRPMSAGLAIAATNEGISKLSYVGSNNDQDRIETMGPVMDGKGILKSENNPFDENATRELNKAIMFFNQYQYRVVEENLKDAERKLYPKENSMAIDIYQKLCILYDFWDKFRDKYGKKYLNHLLNGILIKINENEQVSNYFKSEHPNLIPQLEKNKSFLDKKFSDEPLEKRIKYYLPDLINNSHRRIEEGKYDDAIARLYRAVELIAQITLIESGVIDMTNLSMNKKFLIDKCKVRQLLENNETLFSEFKSINQKAYESEAKTMPLASKQSFDLIDILYKNGNIKNNLYENYENIVGTKFNLRNDSILAHGLNPMKKQKSLNLYDTVMEFLMACDWNIEADLENSKFPKL